TEVVLVPRRSCRTSLHRGEIAKEVLLHGSVLRARGLAGGSRNPGTLSFETTVLCLRDLDEGLFRTGVDRVVVEIESEGEPHRCGLLVEQPIGLVHRGRPPPGDALLGT